MLSLYSVWFDYFKMPFVLLGLAISSQCRSQRVTAWANPNRGKCWYDWVMDSNTDRAAH